MSGLDEYARFYWTVDVAGNTAIPVGGSAADYPSMDTGQFSTENNPIVSGEFGLGYRFYSYDPLSVPTRVPCYWRLDEPSNIYATPGFSSLFFGDYTFDFWLKISPEASGEQTILTCQNGWKLYYNEGELGQRMGAGHRVACQNAISGEYHHIEINRIGSTNQIFVDGVRQILSYDTWNPGTYDQTADYSWYFGVTDLSLRGVDFSIDEFRVLSGIGSHSLDFTPPTEPYSFVTEIPSPTDGTISFNSWSALTNDIYDYSGEAASPVNGRIWFTQNLEMSYELESDVVTPSITNARIRFEGLTELVNNFYGLTIPSITDGAIAFDGLLALEPTIESTIEPIVEGIIYNLGNNAIELPAALVTAPELDHGTWVPPTFSFNFLNALVMDLGLSFLNALNHDVEIEMDFWNALTEQLIVTMNCRSALLSANEVESEWFFLNRLDGSDLSEAYDGFYFSKIHGV